MPKNKVSDLITDQEIAFARLILSGTMTDQRAAEAVGLNPTTAAYIKSKPRVHAYMLEHRALMQQQLVEQEAEGLRRQNQRREQVLDRLWELASLSFEMTRGSITGQVKALSMIVAIEGPDPRPSCRLRGDENRRPPSPTLPLTRKPRKKMGLVFPRPNLLPAQRQTRLPTTILSLTSASPPFPRKRNRLLMPLLFQTPGSPFLSKRTPLPGAADLLKEI